MILPPDPDWEKFDWKGISIFHTAGVLKIGTDALLLANWMQHIGLPLRSFADIGCGSGILTVLLATQYEDAQWTAVDMMPEAIRISIFNFQQTGIDSRGKVYEGDAISLAEKIGEHDLVISNPPFFTNQLVPTDSARATSRHTHYSPKVWMNAFAAMCTAEGSICIVVPYGLAVVWIDAANTVGKYVSHRLDVYSFETDAIPTRTLLCFNSRLDKPIQDRLVIYASVQRYTEAYQTWLNV